MINENKIKSKYSNHKRNAMSHNITYGLSFDEFRFLKLNNCYYCEIESYLLKYYAYYMEVKTPWMTIDRKDPKGGYVINNCVSACFLCNKLKSNIFTAQEFKEIAIKYIKPKWEKFAQEANEDFDEYLEWEY